VNIGSDPFLATALTLWEQVSHGGRTPSQVSILKAPHRKSGVYRLEGADPSGAAVIAKRARRSTIEVERRVYQEVLSVLPVRSLRLYGSADDEDLKYGWLFLEDAGDLEWSAESPEHRHLATRWLAQVHLGAEILVDKVSLAFPGVNYYRDLACFAKRTLLASLSNPALPAQSCKLLERVAVDCSAFEAQWDVVERILTRIPSTLTMPGFGGKNARVRNLGSGLELLAYDFENAFFGSPAIELRDVETAVYWQMAGRSWGVDIDYLLLLATLGGALHGMKSIPGEAESLSSAWPERSVRRIRYYSTRIGQSLDAMGRAGSGSVGHG
jgi:hypothetical protein